MPHDPNPMAQAWLDAAHDLGIRVEHPFQFHTPDGATVTTLGVFLHDFGAEHGALLTCRFDTDDVQAAADETDYFQSALSPHHYEPYNQSTFIAALNDWGWFGDRSATPVWFSGRLGTHGG